MIRKSEIRNPKSEIRTGHAPRTTHHVLLAADHTPGNPPLLGLAVTAPTAASAEFMFMPGGQHTVWLGRAGKPTEVTVQVDRNSAAALQQQLSAVMGKSAHRPFCDFNHNDEEASFWPEGFAWRDTPAPGVYVTGKWSDAGKAAVEGGMYRSFSPAFHVDDHRAKPAKVVCYQDAGLNFGGLVNKPAFKKNLPFWAKDARESGLNQTNADPNGPTFTGGATHYNTMLTPEALAALRAKIKTAEQEIAVLTAKEQTAETAESLLAQQQELRIDKAELRASEAEAHSAQSDAALLVQRGRDADALIGQAVGRGALPPARTPESVALHAKWRARLIENPEDSVMLVNTRGSAALQPMMERQPRLTITNAAISRASNLDMLNGISALVAKNRECESYADKVALSREVAALYGREIIPRLKEGDDIPLRGSNSLGSLAATIVSTRTLELLTLQFPMLKRISTDFSDQIVSYGDTLKTRITGIPAVQTYNQTTGWAISDKTDVDVSITYNQFKGVQIALDAQSIAGTVRRLFEETAPAQSYALAKNMVDYVYTLITAANFITAVTDLNGNAVTATQAAVGDFIRSTLIDIGGKLDDQGNNDNRCIILARPYWSAIKKDAAVISLATFQRPEIIEKGVLNNIEDFDLIKAVNLPATAITGYGNLQGFAFTKSALVLATRLSADYMNVIPGAGNGILTVVSTPAGFSANQVQYVDNKLASTNQRLEVIYGANAGQGAAGSLLTN